MIIVQVKEGELIERALKKFKRKFEKTGIVKELRRRQAFQKPSVTNRKKMMKAVLRTAASCRRRLILASDLLSERIAQSRALSGLSIFVY